MRALIVREPFGDYAKGQAITDPDEIAKVEETHAHHCVETDVPADFFKADEPQPAPAPARPVAVAPAPQPAAPAPQPLPPAAPAAPSA